MALLLTAWSNATQHSIHEVGSHGGDTSTYRTGPQIAGIDLVAMLVSDSGLASTEPVWWNTSPMGCLLIGLQPRGGWQVMQRTVQWGQDRITRAFGVNCTKPALYAYFTCSIRNRVEVWDSPRWTSPMQNGEESGGWMKSERSTVSRPTKLIDGSRGGQAFICDILRPRDGQHYGIEQQARMQLLSVIMVALGLFDDQSAVNMNLALKEDFGLTDRLSVVFRRLLPGVLLTNSVLFLVLATICVHYWRTELLGDSLPYVVEIASIASWAIGATGLLIQGGNPRIVLVESPVPQHVQTRLDDLMAEAATNGVGAHEKTASAAVFEQVETARKDSNAATSIQLAFGSLHGSVYVPDKGHCFLPADVLRQLCKWDLQIQRPWQWYASVMWFGCLLVISIALQIVGTKVSTTGSVVVGVIILLTTSVMRGSGISGPEEWQIPHWKRRGGTSYGAALQGALSSR